jgi:hypothetical protein
MEAARQRDEEDPGVVPQSGQDDSGFAPGDSASVLSNRSVPGVPPVLDPARVLPTDSRPEFEPEPMALDVRPRVDELLVCSLQGEVLHEWQCNNATGRVGFLEFLSQKARQLSQGLPIGDFDRIDVNYSKGRVVAQIQADRALFLRTSPMPADNDSEISAARP